MFQLEGTQSSRSLQPLEPRTNNGTKRDVRRPRNQIGERESDARFMIKDVPDITWAPS
jgi:hypothetical protein